MQNVKPLKKFGQNYLVDQNILNKIIDEINPQKNESIVEIGPGTGSLTKKLLEKVDNLTAIEIDKRVLNKLSMHYENLKLIERDFLKINLHELKEENKRLRIVGNIPYNLTSPILFKLIENNAIVYDSVLMIQLEVAQRLTAKKGTKDYGILAVLLNHFAEVKLCFKVSPNVFFPKPKVFSAVIHIYLKELSMEKIDEKFFIKMVKASFGNRRKTLKNSLSNSIFGDLNFTGSGIDLSLRAEQLNTKDFILIAQFAKEKFSEKGIELK